MKKILPLICLIAFFNLSDSFGQATWIAMGSGLGSSSEEVKTIAVAPDGVIYAGGTFTGAINYIAKYQNGTWSALGTGVDGPVYSIVIKTASDIYVGGDFDNAGGAPASNVARWNGTSWMAIGSGFNGIVRCLHTNSMTGNIYAGGEFSLSGSTQIQHIAKLQSLSSGVWLPLGSGIGANVNAIYEQAHTNQVYAGIDVAGMGPVMKFNGSTWSTVSGLSSGRVLALAEWMGYLYAGGDFTTPIRALAKYDGNSWSTAITQFSTTHKVNTILAYGPGLYIGGNFTGVGFPLSNYPQYIAHITGPNNPIMSFTVSTSHLNGDVMAIGKKDGLVIAGGRFTEPSSSTLNISMTSQTIDVNELTDYVTNRKLYPNPNQGKTTLYLTSKKALTDPSIQVFDSQGRIIKSDVIIHSNNDEYSFEIDLGTQPAGSYYYVLTDNGTSVATDKFMIE